MIDYTVVPYTYDSPLLQQAVRLYVEVWGRDYDENYHFFRRYATYDHFRGYVALHHERVIGLAFGTQSQPGQWWHNAVAQQVGIHHPALQDAWILTELAVAADYRRHQIGSHLLTIVTQDLPLHNLLLSTPIHNHGARRFYERHGWGYLHSGFVFSRGQPVYVIMHKHNQPKSS